MDKKAASEARKLVLDQAKELQSIINELVLFRRELIQGKTTEVLTKCGKTNCRCNDGQKHQAHFLYVSRGGPLQRIWIKKTDLNYVKDRSERYGKFRLLRADLNKAFKEITRHLDVLEEALTVQYKKET